jgi:biotin operon repressor
MSTNSLFDGPTTETDGEAQTSRLGRQLVRVYDVLKDGQWHTLAEIADATGAPEASIAARIRDLRKPRFGGFGIQTQHVGDGLHRYRLVPDTGIIELVYDPAPEPRSYKPEARARLRAFVHAYTSTGRPNFMASIDGCPLLIADIEAMLQ